MDKKCEIIWRAFIITFSDFFLFDTFITIFVKNEGGIYCCDTIILKCEVLQLIFFLVKNNSGNNNRKNGKENKIDRSGK